MELKKISESYDFFGGNSKNFLELYKKTKREPFDFCFLNVDSMEMRRNFDEIVYSKKDEMEKEKILQLISISFFLTNVCKSKISTY